ncbi:hypothetical protein G7Y89_g2380 [Cudoniella acicularis]|uniref:HIT-type domain-containing protein n=1 Tax=Cudoniella acicularis TaxID=354080 RepID=A0A8H4RUJ4_9HELO|nr:hypothetical protein G7Y89_g2380 [Cudoniella acicularis]
MGRLKASAEPRNFEKIPARKFGSDAKYSRSQPHPINVMSTTAISSHDSEPHTATVAGTAMPPEDGTMMEGKVEESATQGGGTDVISTESQAKTETMIPVAKLCGVCKVKEWKYKCSRCYLPYCSIACSTVHKATHPASDTAPGTKYRSNTPPKANNIDVPRPGTVAAAGFRGPFAALDESKELQILFKTFPRLPSQLEEIDAATLPPANSDEIDSLPGTRKKGGKLELWNRDRGLQKGVEALRRAKEAYGKDGEGVREFSKLVLQILSGEENSSVAEAIQNEIAEENARIISLLLNHETK